MVVVLGYSGICSVVRAYLCSKACWGDSLYQYMYVDDRLGWYMKCICVVCLWQWCWGI